MKRRVVLALLAVASVAGSAPGADRVILGDSLVVRNPDGVEQRRTLVGVGKERATDVPGVSDPTVGGAVLTIALDGGTPSTQSYVLDAGGWAAAGSSGYRYVGPTGADGDPVRKVALRGSLGTQPLDVVPPNPGATGIFVLGVAGGDRYCTALGGTAGGTVRRDEAKVWRIAGASAEVACPTTTSTSTTSTSSSTTTVPGVCGNGVVEFPEECEPSAPGGCPPIPEVLCGEVSGPAECRCCVVPGSAIAFIGEEPPPCCDGSECMPVGPPSGVNICECPA
jgi:hypothetical protein